MKNFAQSRRSARHVLSASSLVLAAFLMATPANAQTVDDPQHAVRNDQDYGAGPIRAVAAHSSIELSAGDSTEGSQVQASENRSILAATGNLVSSQLSLGAGEDASPAILENRQSGSGDILALSGGAEDMTGTVIAPVAPVRNSRIEISANRNSASAIGNQADNTISGTGLATGSTEVPAGGASAISLANDQRVVDVGSRPQITSRILGRFAITGDAGAENSRLAVDGNSQRSVALANSAGNELAASGGAGSAASLTSRQEASADISAQSALKLVNKGSVTGSSVSISGNANTAIASMNEAENALADDRYGDLRSAPPALRANGLPASDGPTLSSWQVADGSVSASAATQLMASDAGAGLAGSQFTVSGNSNTADAAANRAANTVESMATSASGSAQLRSNQASTAEVRATSVSNTVLGLVSHLGGTGVVGSVVTLSDNLSSAAARGNSAVNDLKILETNASDTGSASLLNQQNNAGNVMASVGGITVAPSFNDGQQLPVLNSIVMSTGNAASAASYANEAINRVTADYGGQAPFAAIINSQVNSGSVSAAVNGAGSGIFTASLTSGSASITGSQLSAIAVGNQAVNAIGRH